MNPFKIAIVLNGVPKWRNLAKFGHTGAKPFVRNLTRDTHV